MKKILLVFLIVFIYANSGTQIIYVSVLGNDSNPGTKDRPVATFAKAQQLARKLPEGVSVKVLFAPESWQKRSNKFISQHNLKI